VWAGVVGGFQTVQKTVLSCRFLLEPFRFFFSIMASVAVGLVLMLLPGTAGFVPTEPVQHPPVVPSTVRVVHLIQSNHLGEMCVCVGGLW
jgi:hypothetical protein